MSSNLLLIEIAVAVSPTIIGQIAVGDSKTSKLVGKKIPELNLPVDVVIGAIVRKEVVMLANDDLIIETNDHVIIFVLDKKNISKVEKMFQVSVGFF